jgi:hypothetical protein
MARVSPEYGQRNALFEPCPTTEQLQAMAAKMTEGSPPPGVARAGTPVSTAGSGPRNFLLPPCEANPPKPDEKK